MPIAYLRRYRDTSRRRSQCTFGYVQKEDEAARRRPDSNHDRSNSTRRASCVCALLKCSTRINFCGGSKSIQKIHSVAHKHTHGSLAACVCAVSCMWATSTATATATAITERLSLPTCLTHKTCAYCSDCSLAAAAAVYIYMSRTVAAGH